MFNLITHQKLSSLQYRLELLLRSSCFGILTVYMLQPLNALKKWLQSPYACLLFTSTNTSYRHCTLCLVVISRRKLISAYKNLFVAGYCAYQTGYHFTKFIVCKSICSLVLQYLLVLVHSASSVY